MASHRLFTLPVAILVFQSFLLGTSEFIIVGVLPDIASDLNIAVTMVSNLVAIFAFVYAPLTPIGAAICSKFQRFRALIALLLVFLAGNVICTFAELSDAAACSRGHRLRFGSACGGGAHLRTGRHES